MAARQSVQVFRRNRLTFAQFHRAAVGFLADQHTLDTVKCVVVEDADLVVQVLTVAAQLGIDNGLGAFVALDAFACEHLHVNHSAAHAGWHPQRSVFHIRCFFTENRTQQFFFGRKLGFACGRYFADQYVACLHFRTNIDNAAFIQTVLHFFGQVRNIARDVFRTQLGIARHHVQFFNVDRRIAVVCGHFFANQNRVFVVVAVPRHEGDGHVLTERKFTQIGGCAVGNQIAALQYIAFVHGRTLVDVGGLVGTCEFHQIVNVHTAFGCGRFIIVHAHHHAVCVHILHHAATTGNNGGCTVHRHGTFDTRTYQWLLGAQARHSLTLHVRAHQGTVRIVMLQKRNQRSGNGYHLTGRHVHVLHTVGSCQNSFAFFTAGNQFVFQFAGFFINFRVRLRNYITTFFNCRQIIDFIGHFAVYHAAVRRFQEAVIVGACINRQRVNQTNVRTFRRFNRANTTIVGRMHVAHFKARTFACQTARAQCRHTAFVRDFGQRVGLVHKLRQLAGTEKFLNGSRNGFSINQVSRHQTFAFGLIQTLFHGTFHACQTCTELVFHQFANGTHATVAQMVNIVHFAMAVAQLHQRSNRHHDVFHAQNMQFGFFFAHAGKSFIQQTAIPVIFLCRQQFLLISARVEFHAADA